MNRRFFALAALAFSLPATAQQPQQIDNVAAFARLYGVARWFYPSDAAAGLDWNRFAVEGVRRVRVAQTERDLDRILEELFTPLGPGIEIGTTLSPRPATGRRDPALIGWHYRGAALTDNVNTPSYSAKRTNRSLTTPTQPGASSNTSSMVVMQALPMHEHRGKTLRLRAQVRVNAGAQGFAGLWLRIDRAGQQRGFFDNMQDRPIRDAVWREYVIEGPIAADAEQVVFGVLSASMNTIDVDAMQMEVRDSSGTWTPIPVPDGSFEASPNDSPRAWSQTGPAFIARMKSGAAHGAQFARIAHPNALASASRTTPDDSLETPITGATIDLELARGLKARVPLSLSDAEARIESPALAALRSILTATQSPVSRNDADARLADAVVAWNAFRHFYPYWGDVSINWDARLRPQLEIALNAASTREGHYDAIRSVVADLQDGHGNVYDYATRPPLALLPVQFRILEQKLVVTASGSPDVPVGSVVTSIDGTSVTTRVAKETQLASGTPQWRESRAAGALQTCLVDSTVTLTIEPPGGALRNTTIHCSRTAPRATEPRPDSIALLQPGIWYVDLTRIRATQLRPMLDTIAKARGVIFDVRGYPTDAGAFLLPYLMRAREDSTDRWMHVPRFSSPFAEVAAWTDLTWYVAPSTPHIAAQRVFLTDGRAISYAESVMGYVRDYKLGTIIGGATAGANGNVASFVVPGGFSVGFTGMRVTRHDGHTAFHTAGVAPDIPLVPTIAGIRAGRDELLERALAALRIQP